MRILGALASFAAVIALVATAGAAHWSHAGGDPGRSGLQPIDETGPPVALAYTQSDGSPIRTSILTSAGSTASQRVIYSTSDGRVHHRGLDDGEPSFATKVVLSPDFTPDGDVFGSGIGNVAPVEASRAEALGFTFQVFNEDAATTDPMQSDIALSVFRQSDGTLVDTVRIPGGTNYTVNNSPLLFQNALWFVANPDPNPQVPPQPNDATPRLFKVNIGDPAGTSGNPTIGSVKTVNVASANNSAHVTGLYLRDADGNPKPFVAVAFTSGNTVQTFSADTADPVAGPRTGDLAGGTAWSPSVPVLPNGRIPGPGETVTTAPYIYVAEQMTDPVSDFAGTRVVKLTQQENTNNLILAPGESNASPAFIGNPSIGLAVSQRATQAAPASNGRVVVGTNCDLYSIAVADMTDVETLLGPNAVDGCQGTSTTSTVSTGFRNTFPALSGNLGFIQRNNGDQLAFTIDRVKELPADQFRGEADPRDTVAAFGQPSISRRLIQFGDDKRLSVYRAEEPVPPGESGAGFSINDVTVTEGDGGTQNATFTITRSGSLGGTVKVTTADNTAKAGSDYTAVSSQSVTFDRDEASQTVTVSLLPDTADESDETFFVRLSEPSGPGASLVDAEGLGVITDDDATPPAAPNVSVSDVTANEGSTATITIALSNTTTETVTLDYGTTDDTAQAGRDYTTTRGSLSFAPGQTSRTVTVPVLADRTDESVERFFVSVGNVKGAAAPDPVGAVLIADVQPDRLKARGFTASTKPKRDARAPFRFTTTGRLLRPTGLTRAEACTGSVSVQVKALRKTVSNRRTKLRTNCTYRTAVTFKNRKRFTKDGKLKFVARFLGNADVLRTAARKQTVRTK